MILYSSSALYLISMSHAGFQALSVKYLKLWNPSIPLTYGVLEDVVKPKGGEYF